MSAMEARLNVRVDSEVKNDAKEIYESLGIDLSTAINVFLRKSIMVGGFPFNVTNDVPNAATEKAIEDSYKGIGNSKAYSSARELLDALDREE